MSAKSNFDLPINLSEAGASFLAGHHGLLIAGEFCESNEQESFETIDPATSKLISKVATAGAIDVEIAVNVCKEALHGAWARTTPQDRSKILFRFADLLESNTDLIAEVESIDTGKPKAHIAFVDVPLSVNLLRYYAGLANKICGETIPIGGDMLVYSRKEPVGVVAAIAPWNFPLCQACYMIAPALAAGCAVILKPAQQSPLSSLILGKLALEAGLPPGLLNVLCGDGKTGQLLVDHPGIAKISFTGSEKIGKLIAERSAHNLKHVTLELGGKNPNIVFADADLQKASAAAASAIFFYSGQVCSAGSRLFVQESAYDEVLESVTNAAKQIVLGHGLEAATTMGPLISEAQLTRVSNFVTRAVEDGARIAVGGERGLGELGNGSFYKPTVVEGASDKMQIAEEEVFGPVLVIQKFKDMDEVLVRANAVRYGLAAGVWTNDLGRAHRMAARIDSGTVWVNTYNQFSASVPWGGFKSSGYGKVSGQEGIEKYLKTKCVWIDANS